MDIYLYKNTLAFYMQNIPKSTHLCKHSAQNPFGTETADARAIEEALFVSTQPFLIFAIMQYQAELCGCMP